MFTFLNSTLLMYSLAYLQKLTRCYFTILEDFVELSSTCLTSFLFFFLDYVKLNTVEESGSPQYKKL